MADKKVGNRGTLRITDNGSVVSFYVLCSDPATAIGTYRYAINGTNYTTNLPSGFGSKLLGTRTISSSQNVSLSQQDTGTWGLGGAASFSVYIARATVPPSPTPVIFDLITPTSMRCRFSSRGDGGSTVVEWQLQRATNSAMTQSVVTVTSSGTTTVTGLTPATTYYYRARGRNAKGWGAWSAVRSQSTDSGAYTSINGKWVPVPVYGSNGSSWLVPDMQISTGTEWRHAV